MTKRVYISVDGATDCVRVEDPRDWDTVKRCAADAMRTAYRMAKGGACPQVHITIHPDATCEHDDVDVTEA